VRKFNGKGRKRKNIIENVVHDVVEKVREKAKPIIKRPQPPPILKMQKGSRARPGESLKKKLLGQRRSPSTFEKRSYLRELMRKLN
jgi:hypothetical protein